MSCPKDSRWEWACATRWGSVSDELRSESRENLVPWVCSLTSLRDHEVGMCTHDYHGPPWDGCLGDRQAWVRRADSGATHDMKRYFMTNNCIFIPELG